MLSLLSHLSFALHLHLLHQLSPLHFAVTNICSFAAFAVILFVIAAAVAVAPPCTIAALYLPPFAPHHRRRRRIYITTTTIAFICCTTILFLLTAAAAVKQLSLIYCRRWHFVLPAAPAFSCRFALLHLPLLHFALFASFAVIAFHLSFAFCYCCRICCCRCRRRLHRCINGIAAV